MYNVRLQYDNCKKKLSSPVHCTILSNRDERSPDITKNEEKRTFGWKNVYNRQQSMVILYGIIRLLIKLLFHIWKNI